MKYRLPIGLTFILLSAFSRAQIADLSGASGHRAGPSFGGPNERITFLVGRVAFEDGSGPEQSVTVVLECGIRERARAHSSVHGDFSISLTLADGAPGQGFLPGHLDTVSSPSLTDCEVYGDLPGYRSERIRLMDRPEAGVVQVGTITMHSVSPEHSFSVSLTSLAAPEKAKKSLQKGQEQAKKGKWAAAADYFKHAIEEYPRYALAWVELGRTQVQQNSFADAQQSFRQSVAQDSRFLDAYVELAYLALHQKQWKELADTTERLMQFAPNAPEFWFLNSVASFNLGNALQAQTSIERALRLDQKHQIPEMEYLYGLILASNDDHSSAAEHLGAYLRLSPHASNAQNAQKILAECQERAQNSSPASRREASFCGPSFK